MLPENTYQYLIENYNLSEIFGLQATAGINDFASSVKSRGVSPQYRHIPTGILGNTRDYAEEFIEDLSSTFEYSFFKEAANIVVKLHIDYIKHNTVVAFPTVLFVKGSLVEIPYTIRSKHNADIVQGIIHISETNEK